MKLSKEQIEKSKLLVSETKQYLNIIEEVTETEDVASEQTKPILDKILLSVIKLKHCHGSSVSEIKEFLNKI